MFFVYRSVALTAAGGGSGGGEDEERFARAGVPAQARWRPLLFDPAGKRLASLKLLVARDGDAALARRALKVTEDVEPLYALVPPRLFGGGNGGGGNGGGGRQREEAKAAEAVEEDGAVPAIHPVGEEEGPAQAPDSAGRHPCGGGRWGGGGGG